MIDLFVEISKSVFTTTIDWLLFSSYFGSLVFAISFAILEWGLRRLYKYYSTKPFTKISQYPQAKSLSDSTEIFPKSNKSIAIVGALILTSLFIFTPPEVAFISSVASILLLFVAIAVNFIVIGFGISERFDERLKSLMRHDWSLYFTFLGLFLFIISCTWLAVINKQNPELTEMNPSFHLPINIAEIKSYYVQSLIFVSSSILGIGAFWESKQRKWGRSDGSQIVEVNLVFIIILLCIIPAFVLFMAFVFPFL